MSVDMSTYEYTRYTSYEYTRYTLYEYKHCTHLVVVELLGCSDVQHRATVTLGVEQ